jgi:hypothetical protein
MRYCQKSCMGVWRILSLCGLLPQFLSVDENHFGKPHSLRFEEEGFTDGIEKI